MSSDLEFLEDQFASSETRATSKKTSRPRSKNLMNEARVNAWLRVLETHRGRYILEGGIAATRARILRDTDIVPGDIAGVHLTPAQIAREKAQISEVGAKPEKISESAGASNEGGSADLARIEVLKPRQNTIQRTADDKHLAIKTIAANVDNVAIVCSSCSPTLQPDFVRRVIEEADRANARPLLIATKTDLAALQKDLLPAIAHDVKILDKSADFEALLSLLGDSVTVFIGLSGSGKSTLINQIFPDAGRKTAEVSENGDGRHTSTSSKAFPFGTGLIIDTPGIRSFGLGHF